ncbi:transcriptional regulator [Dyella soli]|uniref:Transcriptional regulator n=2 Tax=Dyella soli TaxID=522319 RepID=A0A4R0YEP1_9GAMM|nr:transcriptional regulator [Dyella soli]
MRHRADEAVAVLKGLGNRHRLLLLCQLLDGERSVNELADQLGLAQSVVSQHLSLLRGEGMVAGRREGQSIYYSIRDERVHALMARLFELFCAES